MDRQTIPRKVDGLGAYYPGNDFGRQVDLSGKTYVRHEWHGVAGTVKTSTYESPVVANTQGSMLFMVPTVKEGFEYKDALDIYFEGVGTFQDRKLNARMHFDSIKFGPYQENKKYNISYSSNPAGVFLLRPHLMPEMFFGRSDQQEWFPGFEQRYDAVKDFRITLTITYADDGSVADIPFYQYVSDIDNNNLWNSYGALEGITFGNGFTNTLYTYDGFRCSVNDRTIKVPNDGRNHNYSDFFVPAPVPGATSGERQSNDKRVAEASWFLNACWGVTNNGQFTMTFHGANAVADMNVRSPWLSSSIITLEKKGWPDGENLYWDISYELPRLEDEILCPFEFLTVEDPLSTEISYVKTEIYDDGGNIVNGVANVSYNSSNRTLTADFTSAFLSNKSNYGRTWHVRIYCNWSGDSRGASNTAYLCVNRKPPFRTPPSTFHGSEKPAMGLYKYVVDPQESYGPGDTVTFAVVVDICSYMARHVSPSEYADDPAFSYHNKSDILSGDRVYAEAYVKDFQFTDVIPEGLELIGDVKCMSLKSWRYDDIDEIKKRPSSYRHVTIPRYRSYESDTTYQYSNNEYINTFFALETRTTPVTEEEVLRYLATYGCPGAFYVVPGDVYREDTTQFLYTQPEIAISGDLRIAPFYTRVGWGDSAVVEYKSQAVPENMVKYLKLNTGLRSISDFFSIDGMENRRWHVVDNALDDVDDEIKNPSVSISKTSNKIQVSSSHALWEGWNCINVVDDDNFNNSSWNMLISYMYGNDSTDTAMSLVGMIYQCRVKGNVTNADVTNVSNASCEQAIIAWDVRNGPNYDSNHDDYGIIHQLVPNPTPVSARAEATVHLGGYQITTEAVNGKIDESLYGLDAGDNIDISYQPNGGYYLDRVEVDGTPMSVTDFKNLYRFKNLSSSHHVKVVYEPGYNITTEAVNGKIDEAQLGIRAGENRTIHYEPNDGYMLEKIEVDGHLVDMSICLDSYGFLNVQADHHIKVTYMPKYKIETSIEHGTITPTITGITPGTNHTITYTPDSGYYVKSVTVDGTILSGDSFKNHLTNYVFSNVNEDHRIHVVCAPYPTITITKEIEDSSQIVWAKGDPIFEFSISGTDYLGQTKSYHRTIAFSGSDGKTKSITLRIPAGQWTVSELKFDGWQQVSVRAGAACTVNGPNGVLDTRNASAAGVTFVNRVSDWHRYTENANRINQLK